MLRFFRISNRGMSLMEVMVAAGLTTTVALAIATMMSNQSKQAKNNRAIVSRDEIRLRISRMITDSAVISNSASQTGASAGNATLAACLRLPGASCPAGTPSCCDGDPDPNVPGAPFVLFERGSTTAQVSGAYDRDGKRCGNTASAACPIEVIVGYKAICNGARPCTPNNVGRFVYDYRIGQTNTNNSGTGDRLASYIRTIAGNTDEVAATISGNGTNPRIPMWSTASTLTDSIMMQDTAGSITVGGDLKVAVATPAIGRGLLFNTTSVITNPAAGVLAIDEAGSWTRIGIGNNSPGANYKLHVTGRVVTSDTLVVGDAGANPPAPTGTAKLEVRGGALRLDRDHGLIIPVKAAAGAPAGVVDGQMWLEP